MPKSLVGTDLVNDDQLKEGAIELLKECETESFLDENDFVFMMHQGYLFWYFKLDGNPNPDVWGFSEITKSKTCYGPLSQFLEEYTTNNYS